MIRELPETLTQEDIILYRRNSRLAAPDRIGRNLNISRIVHRRGGNCRK
ncbi:MAG: hypothetical protein IKJ45_01220 [Kiritimatiellae bacterium]|nr:hypothetical protein [Kiritimatiellia bacterium]